MQHRRRTTYVVRRFEFWSLFRLSFFLGGAAGLFPSLVVTAVVLKSISAARQLMENARHVSQTVPLINQRINFDFVEPLGLTGSLRTLTFVDDRALLFGVVMFVFATLLAAVCFSIAAILGAIVYNSLAKGIGGLKVEVED